MGNLHSDTAIQRYSDINDIAVDTDVIKLTLGWSGMGGIPDGRND